MTPYAEVLRRILLRSFCGGRVSLLVCIAGTLGKPTVNRSPLIVYRLQGASLDLCALAEAAPRIRVHASNEMSFFIIRVYSSSHFRIHHLQPGSAAILVSFPSLSPATTRCSRRREELSAWLRRL